jgi:hypothetical protein
MLAHKKNFYLIRVCLLRGGWHPFSTNLVLSLNTLRMSYWPTSHVILFEHLNSCSFSSKASDKKNLPITPFISYSNADIDKFAILKDNQYKIGMYRWVNIETGKSYIGSSRNLSARFRQYFNVNYLEREIKRNNSKIYRSANEIKQPPPYHFMDGGDSSFAEGSHNFISPVFTSVV